MVRLAKEIRLVGRDRIDQMDQFLALAAGREHEIAVFGARGQLQAVQAPPEADLEHRLLSRRSNDTALRMDQRAEPLEIGGR